MKLVAAEDAIVEQQEEKPQVVRMTSRLKPPANLSDDELNVAIKAALQSLPRFKGMRPEQLRAMVFSHDRVKNENGEYLGVVLNDGSKFYYGVNEQRVMLSEDHAAKFNRRTIRTNKAR